MINQLNISNFQSHKETTLDFDSGVNIIVGESDTGKSAIIRALRLLIYNRPAGDVFRSDWVQDQATIVSALFEEGEKVMRLRGKKENKYVLYSTGKEAFEFEAIKTGVPDEIDNALNLNNINLQMQGDNHFLISSSPGEVAQHFNKIAHLSQIDQGLQFVEKEYRSVRSKIDHDTNTIKEYEENLKEYEYLEKFEKEVEVLESRQSELNQIQNGINKLTDLLNSLDDIKSEIDSKNYIIQAEDKTNEIIKLIKERDNVGEDLDKLKAFDSKLQTLDKEKDECNQLLELENQVKDIINLNKTISDISVNIHNLEQLDKKLIKVREEKEKNEKDLQELEEEFHKNIGEVCPLCGTKIK